MDITDDEQRQRIVQSRSLMRGLIEVRLHYLFGRVDSARVHLLQLAMDFDLRPSPVRLLSPFVGSDYLVEELLYQLEN